MIQVIKLFYYLIFTTISSFNVIAKYERKNEKLIICIYIYSTPYLLIIPKLT